MMGRPLLLGHQTLSHSQPNAHVWHDPPPQTIPAPSAGFRTEGSGSITTTQRPTRGRGHHQAAGGAAVVGARSTPQHLRWTREEDSARTHVGPRQGGELEVGCGIVALDLPSAAAAARPSLARQLSTVGCAMSRRPASPHGCSVHSAGLGLRTRPLGGRRRLPTIADSPSGIGEPGGARAPRARAPYPRGRSFRANICDFLAPAPPHAIPRLRGLPSTKLLLQQDALHDRPGTAGAAPPGCVSTRRRPLRGGPSTHCWYPGAVSRMRIDPRRYANTALRYTIRRRRTVSPQLQTEVVLRSGCISKMATVPTNRTNARAEETVYPNGGTNAHVSCPLPSNLRKEPATRAAPLLLYSV